MLDTGVPGSMLGVAVAAQKMDTVAHSSQSCRLVQQ